MSAPSGTGERGRGRGQRSRGAGRSSGGGGREAAPLAAQMRQLNRLQEPKEMATLRRFKDLGATQVRSIYGASGLLSEEVQLPAWACACVDMVVDTATFVSVLVAENALNAHRERQNTVRAYERRFVRLGENRHGVAWADYSPEEKRVLTLSQKEWNSFRAREGHAEPSGSEVPPANPEE